MTDKWRVTNNMYGVGNTPVYGVETIHGAAIANCGSGSDGEANARLIAAAPVMLAALKYVRDEYRDLLHHAITEDERDDCNMMLIVVGGAIAEAESAGAPAITRHTCDSCGLVFFNEGVLKLHIAGRHA